MGVGQILAGGGQSAAGADVGVRVGRHGTLMLMLTRLGVSSGVSGCVGGGVSSGVGGGVGGVRLSGVWCGR